MKSKCYTFVIWSLNLFYMDTLFRLIEAYSTNRTILFILLSLISYNESNISIENHLRWKCWFWEFTRCFLNTSKNLHYESCAIYDRASIIIGRCYEFFEFGNKKRIECFHRVNCNIFVTTEQINNWTIRKIYANSLFQISSFLLTKSVLYRKSRKNTQKFA